MSFLWLVSLAHYVVFFENIAILDGLGASRFWTHVVLWTI
jgi:hypothetical protein